MIPFYIFYSMFGFQRTGDWIWAMADQLARGFLIGATAGRTTLTGEGLQHADGHSPLLAEHQPGSRPLRPGLRATRSGTSSRTGLRRMYGHDDPDHPDGEDLIYYITVYNEPVSQPGPPENLDVEALLRGMYRYASSPLEGDHPRAQILVSGITMTAALKAQRLLAEEWGVAADVWSVTSWNELRRDGSLRRSGTSPIRARSDARRMSQAALDGAPGPVIAVSDYMRGRPRSDRAVGRSHLVCARYRWLRLRRYPCGCAALLPGRRGVDRGVRRCKASLATSSMTPTRPAEAFDRYLPGEPHRRRWCSARRSLGVTDRPSVESGRNRHTIRQEIAVVRDRLASDYGAAVQALF